MGAPPSLEYQFIYASKPNVPDLAVQWTGSSPTVYRIISDHLGSPRVVVDVATGDVMLAVNYDVFGKPEKVDGVPDWDLDELPFGFAGGMLDNDTGLIRFGARDYDPLTGRWTSKDPIRFEGGQGNLYAYVGNDPVNEIDPFGLSDVCDACTACSMASRWATSRCLANLSPTGDYRLDTAARLACMAVALGCVPICSLCTAEQMREDARRNRCYTEGPELGTEGTGSMDRPDDAGGGGHSGW